MQPPPSSVRLAAELRARTPRPRLALAEGAPAQLARELTATFRDELETQRLPALRDVR